MAPLDNIKVYCHTVNDEGDGGKNIDTSYRHFLNSYGLTIERYDDRDDEGDNRETFKNTYKTKKYDNTKTKRLMAFFAFRDSKHTKLSIACFTTRDQFLKGDPEYIVGIGGNAMTTVRRYYNTNGTATSGNANEKAKMEADGKRKSDAINLSGKIKQASPEQNKGEIENFLKTKYEKVFKQLGFGTLESIYNNEATRQNTKYNGPDDLLKKFNPIRKKSVGYFNLSLIKFKYCKVEFVKNNFVIKWISSGKYGSSLYEKTEVAEPGSKEYNTLRSVKEDYVREMYKRTKDCYEQFKKQAAEKDLETDHKNWKEGKPHERSERIVREESYFNY